MTSRVVEIRNLVIAGLMIATLFAVLAIAGHGLIGG
jgi:hypothetical protein